MNGTVAGSLATTLLYQCCVSLNLRKLLIQKNALFCRWTVQNEDFFLHENLRDNRQGRVTVCWI